MKLWFFYVVILTINFLFFATHLYAEEQPASLSFTAKPTNGFYGGSADRRNLLSATEIPAPLSFAAQATYGIFGGSAERKDMLIEAVNIGYATDTFGADVSAQHWKLSRINSLGDLSGNDLNASLYVRQRVATGGYVGGACALTYLTSDDSNTDKKLVPYGAVTYKTPDDRQYFDIGYAYMGFRDTTTNQLTSTWGIALFDRHIWPQTRLYYNNLSNVVQGKGHTVALEERLTWYVVPSIFSLTLYGFAGRRIYGYDPDLRIVCTVPNIQKDSGGLTATVEITPSFILFGDVTYETRKDIYINNNYNITYETLGLTYNF